MDKYETEGVCKMAKRKIRISTDEVLRKICKPVKEITPNILTLLDDMADTMYEAQGVGLAAPQVGIRKRVFVVDIGEGLFEFVNPQIIKTSGTQVGQEGCLSCPNLWGMVERPSFVKVKAFDRYGKEFEIEATDFFARAIFHENDHLDGKLFKDIAKELEKSE